MEEKLIMVEREIEEWKVWKKDILKNFWRLWEKCQYLKS